MFVAKLVAKRKKVIGIFGHPNGHMESVGVEQIFPTPGAFVIGIYDLLVRRSIDDIGRHPPKSVLALAEFAGQIGYEHTFQSSLSHERK